MFKSTKWRSDKTTKIKAVFRLSFQATQLPQLKKKKLTVALVPEDVGKPTVKLEKVAVRDGTCSWENPIYETVKLTRQLKTGQIDEKIYYFVISNSSKAGFVGEVAFDFAEYVETAVPVTVSLPFTCSDSGAHLHVRTIIIKKNTSDWPVHFEECVRLASRRNSHCRVRDEKTQPCHIRNNTFFQVTIQNMHAATKQREPCKSEDGSQITKSRDTSLNHLMANQDKDVNEDDDLTIQQDEYFGKITCHPADQILISRLPSSSNSTAADANPEQKDISSDTSIKYEAHHRSSSDWSEASASDRGHSESTNSPELNYTTNVLTDISEGALEKRKSEVFILMRQVEVMELELQSLRKQVVKETKRGQDLSTKVSSLKQDRDVYKEECEQLKALQKSTNNKETLNKLRYDMDEIQKELNYERKLNTSFQAQLQKTQESNADLILAVRDLEEMLGHKNEEISHLTEEIETSVGNRDGDKEVYEQLVKEHELEVGLLKEKVTQLYGDIEFYKTDKNDLEMDMEHLNQQNENLNKEKHDMSLQLKQNMVQQVEMQNKYSGSLVTIEEHKLQIVRLETEINKRGDDLFRSVETIEELESQNISLEKELEKQAEAFEHDLGAITRAKIEQEQRAIQAEEALRKTRQNNTITAERLQEEFKKLNFQMASKLDENEKLVMKAVKEANELRSQKSLLEEKLKKADKDLELTNSHHDLHIQELSLQLDVKYKEIKKLQLELEDMSKQFAYTKLEGEKKHEAITTEMQILKSQIEKLNMEKDEIFAKSAQKQNMRNESIKETEIMVQKWNKEKSDLEKKLSSAKTELEKLQKELNTLMIMKDEKEKIVASSLSKLDGLKIQYSDLKQSFAKEEMAKENLRKQVAQLKIDLQKKESTVIGKKKIIKENNGRGTMSHSDVANMTPKNNSSTQLSQDSEVASLKEKLKMFQEQIEIKEATMKNATDSFITKEKNLKHTIKELESRIENVNVHPKASTRSPSKRIVKTACSELEHPVSNVHGTQECDISKLVAEVAALKEKNLCMDGDLTDMQERYTEISLKFAEVEGERQQLVMTVRNLKSGKKN